MEKRKYYAVTTSMTFEKTVLVPYDTVRDMDEAIDLVDCGVGVGSVMLLSECDAECKTIQSPYADENGIYELTEGEAAIYQILEGDEEETEE